VSTHAIHGHDERRARARGDVDSILIFLAITGKRYFR
jgi:hypothetical protein